MCAFVGAGIYKEFSAVKNIVLGNKEFLPNPEHFEIYDALFYEYKQLYSALKRPYPLSNSTRF